MEITTTSLKETKHEAAEVMRRLNRNEAGATVLLLYGDLGAGKTSFTQGLAEALGITSTVASPTFVIEKIYDAAPGQIFRRLIHIDAYRLTGGRELSALGFDELLCDPGNLIVIEWPERVADVLPPESLSLYFSFIDDKRRNIRYDL